MKTTYLAGSAIALFALLFTAAPANANHQHALQRQANELFVQSKQLEVLFRAHYRQAPHYQQLAYTASELVAEADHARRDVRDGRWGPALSSAARAEGLLRQAEVLVAAIERAAVVHGCHWRIIGNTRNVHRILADAQCSARDLRSGVQLALRPALPHRPGYGRPGDVYGGPIGRHDVWLDDPRHAPVIVAPGLGRPAVVDPRFNDRTAQFQLGGLGITLQLGR